MDSTWACSTCTFLNQQHAVACEICGMPRGAGQQDASSEPPTGPQVLYTDIQNVFFTQGQFYFKDIATAAELMLETFEEPDTKNFVATCVPGITNSVLDFKKHVSIEYVNCMQTFLLGTVRYLSRLVKENDNLQYLETIGDIVDPSRAFYNDRVDATLGLRVSGHRDVLMESAKTVCAELGEWIITKLLNESPPPTESLWLVRILNFLHGYQFEELPPEQIEQIDSQIFSAGLESSDFFRTVLPDALRGVLRSVIFGLNNPDTWRLHLEVVIQVISGNKLALRLVAVEHLSYTCVIVMNTKIKTALTSDELSQWLMSPSVDIINVLFGDRLHVEVLSRAGDVLVFLARAEKLTLEHLSQMWEAAQGKHETVSREIHDRFRYLSLKCPPEMMMNIISIAHSMVDADLRHVLTFLSYLPNVRHPRTLPRSSSVTDGEGIDPNQGDEYAQLTISRLNLLWAVASHKYSPLPPVGAEWQPPAKKSSIPLLGFTSVEASSAEPKLRAAVGIRAPHKPLTRKESYPAALGIAGSSSGDSSLNRRSLPLVLTSEEEAAAREQTSIFIRDLNHREIQDDIRREFMGKACRRIWELVHGASADSERKESSDSATGSATNSCIGEVLESDTTIVILDLLGRIIDSQARVAARRRNPGLAPLEDDDELSGFSVLRYSWPEVVEESLKTELLQLSGDEFFMTLFGTARAELTAERASLHKELLVVQEKHEVTDTGVTEEYSTPFFVVLLLREIETYLKRCPCPNPSCIYRRLLFLHQLGAHCGKLSLKVEHVLWLHSVCRKHTTAKQPFWQWLVRISVGNIWNKQVDILPYLRGRGKDRLYRPLSEPHSKLSTPSLPPTTATKLLPLLFQRDSFDAKTMDDTAFDAFQSLFLLVNCAGGALEVTQRAFPALGLNSKRQETRGTDHAVASDSAVQLAINCYDDRLTGLDVLDMIVMDADADVADRAAHLLVTIMGTIASPLQLYGISRGAHAPEQVRRDQLGRMVKQLASLSDELQDSFYGYHSLATSVKEEQLPDEGEDAPTQQEMDASLNLYYSAFLKYRKKIDRLVRLLSLYVSRVLRVPKAKQHGLRCRCEDTINVLSPGWRDSRVVAVPNDDPFHYHSAPVELENVDSTAHPLCPPMPEWSETYSTANLKISTVVRDETSSIGSAAYYSGGRSIPHDLQAYILHALESPIMLDTKQRLWKVLMALPTAPEILQDLSDPNDVANFAVPLGVEAELFNPEDDKENGEGKADGEEKAVDKDESPAGSVVAVFRSPWSVLYLLQTIHGKLPPPGYSYSESSPYIAWLRQLSLSPCLSPLLITILLYADSTFPTDHSELSDNSYAIHYPFLSRPICSLCLRILEPLMSETPSSQFRVPHSFAPLCKRFVRGFSTELVTAAPERGMTTPPRRRPSPAGVSEAEEDKPLSPGVRAVRSPMRSPPASPLRSKAQRFSAEDDDTVSAVPAIVVAFLRLLEHNYAEHDEVSVSFCQLALESLRSLLEQSINACVGNLGIGREGSSADSSPASSSSTELNLARLQQASSTPSRVSRWRDETSADAKTVLSVMAWSMKKEVMGLVTLAALMDAPAESVRVLVAKFLTRVAAISSDVGGDVSRSASRLFASLPLFFSRGGGLLFLVQRLVEQSLSYEEGEKCAVAREWLLSIANRLEAWGRSASLKPTLSARVSHATECVEVARGFKSKGPEDVVEELMSNSAFQSISPMSLVHTVRRPPSQTRPFLLDTLRLLVLILRMKLPGGALDLDAPSEAPETPLFSRLANILTEVCLFSPSDEETSHDAVISANVSCLHSSEGPPLPKLAKHAQTSHSYSLCWTSEERRAAFTALFYLHSSSHSACTSGEGCDLPSSPPFELLSSVVERVVHRAGAGAHAAALPNDSQWAFGETDQGRGPTGYVGLRNLGCTCYLNSVVQQLYMCHPFLFGLMTANPTVPLSLMETEVSSIAKQPEGPSTTTDDTKKENDAEDAHELAKEERVEQERVKTAIADAKLLLELQKCFLWLRAGDVRFYDPTPLVKACNALALTYSVYHQNDAAEFCDRLVSHLEHRLAGTPQRKALLDVFGGKLVSQTVRESGHITESEAPFTFLEVAIKNKVSLLQALRSQMEGELMTGDNKVWCEKTQQRVTARLRTCISTLPKLLVLHLKRFDFNLKTMTTEKINSRCSFPRDLDLYPFTKWGAPAPTMSSPGSTPVVAAEPVEATKVAGGSESKGMEEAPAREEELKRAEKAADEAEPSSGGEGGDSVVEGAAPADSETKSEVQRESYNLVGVLLHSGTANSGHYLSIIKRRMPRRMAQFMAAQQARRLRTRSRSQSLGSSESPAPDDAEWETLEDLEMLFEESCEGTAAEAARGQHHGAWPEPADGASELDAKEDVWLLFDDISVTPFDMSNLEKEAFGGTIRTKMRDPILLREEVVEEIAEKNALLLFYEKETDVHQPDEEADATEVAEDTSGEKSPDKEGTPVMFDGPPTSALLAATVANIEEANNRNALLRHRFDLSFLSFLTGAARLRAAQLAENPESSRRDTKPDVVLQEVAWVFMETVMRLRSICRPLKPVPKGQKTEGTGDVGGAALSWDVEFGFENEEKSLGDAMVTSLVQIAAAHGPSYRWLVKQVCGPAEHFDDPSKALSAAGEALGEDSGAGAGAGAGAGDVKPRHPPPPPLSERQRRAEGGSLPPAAAPQATGPPTPWLEVALLHCTHEQARVVFASFYQQLVAICSQEAYRAEAEIDLYDLEQWAKHQRTLDAHRVAISRATKACSAAKRTCDNIRLEYHHYVRDEDVIRTRYETMRIEHGLPGIPPQATAHDEDSVSDLLDQPSSSGSGLSRADYDILLRLRDAWRSAAANVDRFEGLVKRCEEEITSKKEHLAKAEKDLEAAAAAADGSADRPRLNSLLCHLLGGWVSALSTFPRYRDNAKQFLAVGLTIGSSSELCARLLCHLGALERAASICHSLLKEEVSLRREQAAHHDAQAMFEVIRVLYENSGGPLPPPAHQVIADGRLLDAAFASLSASEELQLAAIQLGTAWYQRGLKERLVAIGETYGLFDEGEDAAEEGGEEKEEVGRQRKVSPSQALALQLAAAGQEIEACAVLATEREEWLPQEPLEWLLHRLRAYNYCVYVRHYHELLRSIFALTPEILRFGLADMLLRGRRGLLSMPPPPEGRSREMYERRARDNALRALSTIGHFTEVRVLLRRHWGQLAELIGPKAAGMGTWGDGVACAAALTDAGAVSARTKHFVIHVRVWAALLEEVLQARGRPTKPRRFTLKPGQSVLRVKVKDATGKRVHHIANGLYRPTQELPTEAVKNNPHVYCRDVGHVRIHLLRCTMQRTAPNWFISILSKLNVAVKRDKDFFKCEAQLDTPPPGRVWVGYDRNQNLSVDIAVARGAAIDGLPFTHATLSSPVSEEKEGDTGGQEAEGSSGDDRRVEQGGGEGSSAPSLAGSNPASTPAEAPVPLAPSSTPEFTFMESSDASSEEDSDAAVHPVSDAYTAAPSGFVTQPQPHSASVNADAPLRPPPIAVPAAPATASFPSSGPSAASAASTMESYLGSTLPDLGIDTARPPQVPGYPGPSVPSPLSDEDLSPDPFKVKQLTDMGIEQEVAEENLRRAHGDVTEALALIFEQ